MAEIVITKSQIRRELDHPAERRLGLGELPELAAHDADVVEGLRTRGVAVERPGEGGERLLWTVELAERGTQVRPGRGETRQPLRRGAEGGPGALHVVEPQPEFSALEVRRRPLGRPLQRLVQI